MFINMQDKTQDEIQIYKNELIKEHSLKESKRTREQT